MGKLIEIDKVIEIIEEKQKALCPNGQYGRHYVYGSDRDKFDELEEILMEIVSIPTVDAELVRHGKWLAGGGSKLKCSECGHVFLFYSLHCPKCDAKMDAE